MPSDVVTFAVTTGVGVSLLAGIVSGVCYVLAHKIRRTGRNRGSAQWHCTVCDVHLRSIEGVLESERVVTCARCEGSVCKVRCSRRSSTDDAWVCESCSKHSSAWPGIFGALQSSSKVHCRGVANTNGMDDLEGDLAVIRKRQKQEVRDFIEKLVSSMIGDSVDDSSVDRLYNDKPYLPTTAAESPCTAHTALKLLIQKIIKECIELPSLQKPEDFHNATSSTEIKQSYEDLLATAVLNKVITNCQRNLPSSSANSVSSRVSTSSRNRDDGKEYYFGEETLDSKWKTTDLDSTSVSSLEEWIQSDSSMGSTKYVDKVSLTIQHRIEEVTPTDSENEDEVEDSAYFQKNRLFNDEDSNWFLQKRQFQGCNSPVPVPMLVPKPTSEAKVLIGDKEVDETSDLSDAESDYGEIESYVEAKNVLVESKRVIGGKNILESVKNLSDDELSADSGVKVGSDTFEKELKDMSTARTDATVDDDNVEDVSILSNDSNTEKDTEYTEKYGSIPRQIYKTIPKSSSSENKQAKESKHYQVEDEYENIEFTGVYSKKEKEKWKNAIEMKNNPYTKENIEKRLSSTRSSLSSFGSDYYARQASKPSGGKKKKEDDENAEVSSTVPFWNSEEYQVSDKEANDSDGKHSVEMESQEQHITLITDSSDAEATISEIPSITSDSDTSYVNCYDVENSTVYKKSLNNGNDNKGIEPQLEYKIHSTTEIHHTRNIRSDDELDSNKCEQPSLNKTATANNKQDKPQKYTKNITITKTIDITIPKFINKEKSEHGLSNGKNHNHKSDNTLIKKIYSDPSVRSFALAKRDTIPTVVGINEKTSEQYESTSSLTLDSGSESIEMLPPLQRSISTMSLKTKPKIFCRTFSETPLQFLRQGSKSNDTIINKPLDETLTEIKELQEKKLVASRLGEFSQSFPNISAINNHKTHNVHNGVSKEKTDCSSDFGGDNGHMSVQSLRKKFEKADEMSKGDKLNISCSLTARSLSKHVRETLKNQNMDEPASIDVVKRKFLKVLGVF